VFHYETVMNIAAVQLDIHWEDRPANHARVAQLIEQANVPAGALIVLPEMFDTGFSMNTAATDPGERSASEQFCRKLAAERNVAVLAGVVARTGATGGLSASASSPEANTGGQAASGTQPGSKTSDHRLANEAVAFSPDGSELVRYRKIQPFTLSGEDVHYPAGTHHAGFEWQGVHVAPFICYDLRFPEVFRPAARAGAELIVVVAEWPERRSEHWVRLLQARAIENQAYVLGVNRCGSDPTLSYDGRSALFDPHGNEIFQADRREQVCQATIDVREVRSWREQFPALRDMRQW
jgi:omega-amidase